MKFTVLVVSEGTFEIEADSLAEAEAELDEYSEGEVLSAVEWGTGFNVEAVSIVDNI